MKSIGLFGGSFDPVHLGHLLVAQSAMEELALERLFFIPAAQSPFKPHRQPTPAQWRLRLLRLALAGHSRYTLDDQEIIRGGVSYTIDTVRAYAARFSDARLYYLIGADHVAQLPKWRDSAELARLVHFAVIPRPGDSGLSLPPGVTGIFLKGFPLGLSSSQIRERVRNRQAITHLVLPAVGEAILNNGLYL